MTRTIFEEENKIFLAVRRTPSLTFGFGGQLIKFREKHFDLIWAIKIFYKNYQWYMSWHVKVAKRRFEDLAEVIQANVMLKALVKSFLKLLLGAT